MNSNSPAIGRPATIDVLGIPVAPVRMGEAVAWVAAWVTGGAARMVCTVNPEMLMEARRNPAFRAVLLSSDMNVPDGIGTVLAARLAGARMPERVAGADLVQALANAGHHRHWRVFLLGGRPGVAEAAAEALKACRSGLEIAGLSAASSAPACDEETVARINTAGADILLVAFGAPVQEMWMSRNLHRLHCPVSIGVGGTFDYLAQRAARAPAPVRAAGLEWAFRLVQEPWRWRRMRALPVFAALALKDAARRSRASSRPG